MSAFVHGDPPGTKSYFVLLQDGEPHQRYLEDLARILRHPDTREYLTPAITGIAVDRVDMTEQEAARIGELPSVKQVELNEGLFRPDLLSAEAARRFHSTQLAQAVGAPAAPVAILDSGIDQTHYNRINSRFLAAANFTADNNFFDQHGHGTWCTGCIAEITEGAGAFRSGLAGFNAPPGKLIMAKVFDDASATDFGPAVLNAINFSVARGAKVMSMSIGRTGQTSTSVICQTIDKAHDNDGVNTVASTGNSQSGSTALLADNQEPGASDRAITVGYVDEASVLAAGSQWGNTVDCLAVGVAIRSWGLNGSYLQDLSGSSMSTPHVAGVVAILRGLGATAGDAKTLIRERSRSIGHPQTKEGRGIMQAWESVRALV